MCCTPEEFKTYLTTKSFHDDHAKYCGPRSGISPTTSNGIGNQGGSRLPHSTPGAANGTGALMAQEFRQSVKRDIAYYPDLKDEKGLRIVVLYQNQKCTILTLYWMRLMSQRLMKKKLFSKKCRSSCMSSWKNI
jgi:hypothetical protein